MSIRAIIFDLDGTLLDTLEDIANSMNQALNKLGFPSHLTRSYKTLVGNGVSELARQALPNGTSQEVIDECLLLMRNFYQDQYNQHTQPYPGIVELLQKLKRLGPKLAVLSNKPHEFTEKIVNEYFPPETFEKIWGAKKGIPHKPHPASALALMAELKVEPHETMLVGDSAVDVQTAINAGITPIAVLWGFRSLDELKRAGAQLIVNCPIELFSLIQNLER
ncbi:MAG: HAD family hydrolase [Pseudomonadota bacterium]